MDAAEVLVLITGASKAYALYKVGSISSGIYTAYVCILILTECGLKERYFT
jgi:hypothetical protein